MADTLDYLLRLQDGAFTGPMNKARTATGALNRDLKAAGIGAAGLGTAAGTAAAGMGTLTAATASFAAVAAPIIATLAAIVAAAKALGSSVSAAANFESTSIAFEGLIGDATRAKQTLQELVSFAANMPFELPEVTKSAQTLLGAGVAADKLTGSMNSLGNITAAFQGDLTTVATIFGQVVNKGKLYAEEIQQFGENGIPALTLLSESLGKTKAEVIAAATAGELGASDLAAAFDKAGGAGGKFGNAMQRQALTTKGLWSTLKDSFGQVFTTLGQPINDALRPMMAQLIKLVNQFGAGLKIAIDIGRNAIAQGKLGEALAHALTLGAKLGANGIIGIIGELPGKLASAFSIISQAVTDALTGGFDFAKKNLLGSFNLGTMKFDTKSHEEFFKKLMTPPGAQGAGGIGGGLADAIPAFVAADADGKKGKAGGKEKAEKETERERRKIHGYSGAQRATNPFLDQRSFNEFFTPNLAAKGFRSKKSGYDQSFDEFFHPDRNKGAQLDNHGTLSRRDREKAASEAAAKAAKPRWDKVESIEKLLSNLTVG